MTVIYEEENCKLIKHETPLESFQEDDGNVVKYRLKDILFCNFKRKQKEKFKRPLEDSEIEHFLIKCREENLFPSTDDSDVEKLKTENIKLMNEFYANSSEFGAFIGENNLDHGKVISMNESFYLIPPNCKFFNKKIDDIESFLPPNEANKFDFIVLDPPWKNRYIKRVKRNNAKQGYFTMSDDEIIKIPLENYIKNSSIVVIWCTNSPSHIEAVQQKFLAKWKLKLLSTWQWVKVDKRGELFCALDGNKKPFELIFIATHRENGSYDRELENNFLIFSQPSSIHSHKPPLISKHLR